MIDGLPKWQSKNESKMEHANSISSSVRVSGEGVARKKGLFIVFCCFMKALCHLSSLDVRKVLPNSSPVGSVTQSVWPMDPKNNVQHKCVPTLFAGKPRTVGWHFFHFLAVHVFPPFRVRFRRPGLPIFAHLSTTAWEIY